ncbi:tetratricopeptide repeat protein [Candidatus Kaiserbacteria bacterium]|nr:tetratricopeptide repeat protein [Candidatus Kaiserbacteria bacterium]
MEINNDSFSPSIRGGSAPKKDLVESWLVSISHNLVFLALSITPLFFIPLVTVPLGYSKIFLVAVALSIAIILYSLSILRTGSLRISIPPLGYALWGVVAAALISALLSGDRYDAIFGNTLEVQTVGFLIVIASLVTIPLLLNFTKAMIVRVLTLFGASAILLSIYHLSRLILGSEFLSFEAFNNLTSSPFGGWNSLAIFFGLVIILSMITLEQLPLTKSGRLYFVVAVILSLIMLVVINFFAIWGVLVVVSLIVLMYGLVKDRFGTETLARESKTGSSLLSISLSAMVCLVSLVAILGGQAFSSTISNLTAVDFLEVRPSVGATLDITKSVYATDSVLGVGPNRFTDAWQAFKNPAINQTIFWNVDFVSGYSYFTTTLVTLGMIGVFAWLVFLILFVYTGFRFILKSREVDTLWFYIGSSSFAAGLYLWGMLFVYTPSSIVFVLAAFFTSCLCASYVALNPSNGIRIELSQNKRTAVVLVGATMVVMLVSVSSIYVLSRHYSSVVMFNQAINSVLKSTPIDQVEQKIEKAYLQSPNDLYVRQVAEYQLSKINTLLNKTEPSEIEQKEFEKAVSLGILSAQRAIESDGTNSSNWRMLGAFYSVLAGVGIEGSKERALESYEKAKSYDPQNPFYDLLTAQLYVRVGEVDSARESLRSSITKKPNYTDALIFLTELDVSQGNVDSAIETTLAVLSLEPQNPARYFQLGILYTSSQRFAEAIDAFERAVELDNNYANARFFLARLYATEGKKAEALQMLQVVSDLNPGNQEVANLRQAIESDLDVGFVSQTTAAGVLPEDEPAVSDVVTTQGDPDTNLVTPVNVSGNTDNGDTDEQLNENDSDSDPEVVNPEAE